MNFNQNIKMAEKSIKTHKNVFQACLSSLHIVCTPVIPFDNFTDVFGLFDIISVAYLTMIDIKRIWKMCKFTEK